MIIILLIIHSGFVSWTEVCGCSHIQHTRGGCVDFTDIARALRVLHHHRRADWGDDDVISIMEELTSTSWYSDCCYFCRVNVIKCNLRVCHNAMILSFK